MNSETKKIRPIPDGKGVGLFAFESLPDNVVSGRRLEQIGRFYNYHATPNAWDWPVDYTACESHVIDAFSPNLNKQLHVGHLRNLAVATSLSQLLPESKFVAMLGAAIGEVDGAEARLNKWFDFVDYHPICYKDKDLNLDEQFYPGHGEYEGCRVWEGPNGPLVVKRSDGTATYNYHDLAFATLVGPDYYVTGAEQKEHFDNLDMGDRHLPMGLVLDPETGKKMKSRDGNALSADEAMQLVIDKLQSTPESEKLAWNVLAWNFLHVNRSQNLKFDVNEWTKPESPGMYITYTYARLHSALTHSDVWDKVTMVWTDDLTDLDVQLLAYSSYLAYWKQRAIETMDSAPLAHFTHELARRLGAAYHAEQIIGGRLAFQYALYVSVNNLISSMKLLGMFALTEV